MSDLKEILEPVLKEEGVDRESIYSTIDNFINQRTEEFTAQLRQNKDTILDEKRQTKAELDSYKGKYGFLDDLEDGFSQEKYSDMISQIDNLKSSMSQTSEDLSSKLGERYDAGKEAAASTFTPKLNALEMEKKQISEERDKYKTQYQNFQVQNKLGQAINNIGIKPDDFWFEGFKASSKANFDESGLTEISVRHKGNYIPLEDWVNVFPTTDEGKKMIPAGFNTGGGATGSGSGSGGARTLEDIGQMQDPAARAVALDKFLESAK